MENRSHYNLLAGLLKYPEADYPQKVKAIREGLAGQYPAACEEIDQFLALLPANDPTKMQELYTRSFDVQAMTTLDVGYVLFGDDYKRGVLLANLNGEYRDAEIDTGTELADHIPNLLRLMAVMRDEELLRELALDDRPVIRVLNKVDKLPDPGDRGRLEEQLSGVCVSARSQRTLQPLMSRIERTLWQVQ